MGTKQKIGQIIIVIVDEGDKIDSAYDPEQHKG